MADIKYVLNLYCEWKQTENIKSAEDNEKRVSLTKKFKMEKNYQ